MFIFTGDHYLLWKEDILNKVTDTYYFALLCISTD